MSSTIKIFYPGEVKEVLELFAPKKVADIFALQLFPNVFGLRAREGTQGVGPTYVMADDVPAGEYVLAVRAPDKSLFTLGRHFQLRHLDAFKLRKSEEHEEEEEEEENNAQRMIKHDLTDGSSDTSGGSSSGGGNGNGSSSHGNGMSLYQNSNGSNVTGSCYQGAENRCEFCPALIEGRRVICGSETCRVAYARSRARLYRAQKKRMKEEEEESEKLVAARQLTSINQPDSENTGHADSPDPPTDDEATDDEDPLQKMVKRVACGVVNKASPFWRLVPERARIFPTPIPWDKLGVGHSNPEKGIWYRAAYVYGAHIPNQWHERSVVSKILDRDTAEDRRTMRSVFLPRVNNLKDTPYFPPLDRSQEPTPNALLMMKGEGRGQCGYAFMVWNITKCYGCPMTLLLSRQCPFPDSCPVDKAGNATFSPDPIAS